MSIEKKPFSKPKGISLRITNAGLKGYRIPRVSLGRL